ncbi:hypothetical protein SARC_00929 [Sphaeroforma arctica JP610]|uniref:Uncharacterized protein n=1 Tax=Sphaeroforma arctica JP610 TaxID=667725 RepID=A0A0L0GD32_9EUKA|nr:hypothetical protein SARC_00929 [Sphaeroforma arctica JP610]KNC86927.1 hypothetical protein SARC_00929 [Sphaeroforma arctica JP610]|eukprot:XP_014160829.1 hypothetical protein SARC_00929 [Sphaeroforma arctica JP610]
MTKRRGKAKASKNSPKKTSIKHTLTPDSFADDAVDTLMEAAPPPEVIEDTMVGRPKSKKSNKSKDETGDMSTKKSKKKKDEKSTKKD